MDESESSFDEKILQKIKNLNSVSTLVSFFSKKIQNYFYIETLLVYGLHASKKHGLISTR